MFEVGGAPTFLRGFTQIPLPEEVVEDNETRTVITRYTPIGVVAAIVPWNFPVLLALGKLAPAVLTGNVIIIKPSSVSHGMVESVSWLTCTTDRSHPTVG